MDDNDILINDISFLKGYDLLISFSNGEDRIIDLSDSFNIPAALRYANPGSFRQFDFDKYSIWWGDRDSVDAMEIGNDSLYRLSLPVRDMLESYSSKISNLSMATVFEDKQLAVLGRIKGQENERPHMRMQYKGDWYRVRLEDGVVYKPSNASSSVKSLLGKLAIEHRSKAVELWNKWNPDCPADPNTGKFIDRKK